MTRRHRAPYDNSHYHIKLRFYVLLRNPVIFVHFKIKNIFSEFRYMQFLLNFGCSLWNSKEIDIAYAT